VSNRYRIYFINGEVTISRTTDEEAIMDIFTSRLLSRQDFHDMSSAIRFLEYTLEYIPALDPLLRVAISLRVLKEIKPTQFQYCLDWE
jgi:hypothetical protein